MFWTSNLNFINENWIFTMARHHANNILLTFDFFFTLASAKPSFNDTIALFVS